MEEILFADNWSFTASCHFLVVSNVKLSNYLATNSYVIGFTWTGFKPGFKLHYWNPRPTKTGSRRSIHSQSHVKIIFLQILQMTISVYVHRSNIFVCKGMVEIKYQLHDYIVQIISKSVRKHDCLTVLDCNCSCVWRLPATTFTATTRASLNLFGPSRWTSGCVSLGNLNSRPSCRTCFDQCEYVHYNKRNICLQNGGTV